jgi:hypothetical protein
MRKPVRRHGSWFEYVDEAIGDGYVTVKLSSWLKPFLIQVRSEFFKYKLGYALGMQREYAIRLYQLLKRWQFARQKTITIEQLRLEIGATEVNHDGKITRESLVAYKHFKSKALVPAINEINAKTDLSVSYKEEKAKGSKAVRGITFAIRENLENVDALRPIAFPDRPQMELSLGAAGPAIDSEARQVLSNLAKEFGLSKTQETALQGYVARDGLDYLLEKAAIVRAEPRSNAGRAFIAALKTDWQRPMKIEKKKPASQKRAEPAGWREWLRERYPKANLPGSFREFATLYSDEARKFMEDSGKLAAAN